MDGLPPPKVAPYDPPPVQRIASSHDDWQPQALHCGFRRRPRLSCATLWRADCLILLDMYVAPAMETEARAGEKGTST